MFVYNNSEFSGAPYSLFLNFRVIMFGLKTAVKMSRCVQVEWEDGLLARFNYLWLQDNSVRRPSLVHLDLNTKPEAVNYSRDALNLVWPPYMASK